MHEEIFGQYESTSLPDGVFSKARYQTDCVEITCRSLMDPRADTLKFLALY